MVDSVADLESLAKNGVYKVGQDFFNHKFNALRAASLTHQPVDWHFGQSAWHNFDWTQQDGFGLAHWYRQRAMQLRDKYDYLILAFSGGADSANILDTFRLNDIALDEVWCDWPLQHTADLRPDCHDRSASNMFSEWHFSIKPQLERLRAATDWKITLTDSTSEMEDEDLEDTSTVSQYCYYATVKRWRRLRQLVAIANKTHNKIGVIVGVDLPQLIIINGVLCVYFKDSLLQIKTDYHDGSMHDIEYFYWSTEMPELPRCQCHTILQWIVGDPKSQQALAQGRMDPAQQIQIMHTPDGEYTRYFLKKILYPTWDLDTFQVEKPRGKLYHNEFYDWMLRKFHGHRSFQSHRACLDSSFHDIDDQWLCRDSDTNLILDYQPFMTKFYPVGRV